jgi:hypothetical protein
VSVSNFGSHLETLELKKKEFERLLKTEYNPYKIHSILDHLSRVNEKILIERRKGQYND